MSPDPPPECPTEWGSATDSPLSPSLAHTVLEVIDTAVLVLDDVGRMEYLNPACEDLSGYKTHELQGEIIFDVLIPEDEQEKTRRYWGKLLNGDAPSHHQNPWITKSGKRRYLTWSNAVVETDSGLSYVVATGTDISQRRELERDVVQVSETERQRIGQELHDTLASDLVAAAMKLENLRGHLSNQNVDDPDLHSRLETIERNVRQASKRARSLSHLLAAGQLAPAELPGALSELVKTYEEASEAKCQLQLPDEKLSGLLDGPVAGHLYRIAQEAVRNAIQHGHPNQVDVLIDVVEPSDAPSDTAPPPSAPSTADGRQIVLQIRDDGTGIPDAVSNSLCSEHRLSSDPAEKDLNDGIGLHLMTYRADLIDATLTIDSPDGGGTIVRCALPIN
ncbi:hypothetical protein BSZ35_13510 [Salinibacter sp. 10B]|uniref:PAS domain-containing sensor histidine kinase n=1 Tax=Salinibacter sp. 10B TaxID=1923971 RepID=UPI000CF39E3C|nr:PAS domain S-box protein [Salinibacter sp. 10B]PQJ35485.1 hypothetical protein BSZ35_13510 [Salinibacter sp. 10B]